MSAELNHTIVWSRDKNASAQFLASILGVETGAPACRSYRYSSATT